MSRVWEVDREVDSGYEKRLLTETCSIGVDLIRLGCIKRDELLALIQENVLVKHGLTIRADGE